MPDAVAGALERLFRSRHPDAVEPDPDALVFADPLTGDPLVHERTYQGLRASPKAAVLDETFGSTRCGTATERRSRGRVSRCARVPICGPP
jgi:hypothetical protein